MIDLDLMMYRPNLSLKNEEGKTYLFDPLRQKWLVLQPEELVRQLFIQYLVKNCQCNKNRIGIENGISVNQMARRYDILVFNDVFEPFMLVECKSPNVKLNEETFYQAIWYNTTLKVEYLTVTNGIQTKCYRVDYQSQSVIPQPDLPAFN